MYSKKIPANPEAAASAAGSGPKKTSSGHLTTIKEESAKGLNVEAGNAARSTGGAIDDRSRVDGDERARSNARSIAIRRWARGRYGVWMGCVCV